MIIKFEVTYNSESQGSKFRVDSPDIELEHSGSSYLRIKKDGKQIGQIDGLGRMDGAEKFYNYFNIVIGKDN
jgi:hypothetical protein